MSDRGSGKQFRDRSHAGGKEMTKKRYFGNVILILSLCAQFPTVQPNAEALRVPEETMPEEMISVAMTRLLVIETGVKFAFSVNITPFPEKTRPKIGFD